MNYSVIISTNPQVWKVAAHVDNVANLVKGCNCKDATTRGPICKHAAACLLMECRRVQQPIVDGQEPEAEQQPSPSSGKWLLARFRKLTRVGRLSQKELPKKALLAIKASPHDEVKVVATSVAAPAGRIKSAVKTTQTHVAFSEFELPADISWSTYDAPGRCAVEMLGGPAVQDKVIELIQTSKSWEVIRLMAYTFDYGPLVA